MKLFYKQFRVSHDPLKAIASEEILYWFNEQLMYYGQARWNARGKKWRSIRASLSLGNVKYEKCEAVNNKRSTMPQLSTLCAKRKLF